jgi:hypothetical protein
MAMLGMHATFSSALLSFFNVVPQPMKDSCTSPASPVPGSATTKLSTYLIGE